MTKAIVKQDDEATPAEPKRKRGREKGFVMGVQHRTKIANSNIVRVLLEHIEGKREMGATQVTAGLGLLRKVMPDLANIELSGDQSKPIKTVTRIELVAPESVALNGDRED